MSKKFYRNQKGNRGNSKGRNSNSRANKGGFSNRSFIRKKDIKLIIDRLISNQINFLPGTISPSKSSVENQELESLELGIEHYHKRGIHHLIIQPKWMGSRCVIYLNSDISKCYASSRSGFIIKKDLTSVYSKLIKDWEHEFNDNLDWIILDGEILPWSLLSTKETINRDFLEYSFLHELKNKALEESGFYKLRADILYNQNFTEETKPIFDLLFNYEDSLSLKNNIERFNSQIELYSKELDSTKTKEGLNKKEKTIPGLEIEIDEVKTDEVETDEVKANIDYKAFNILKRVFKDGTEKVCLRDNYINYRQLSDEYVVIDTRTYLEDDKFWDFMKWIAYQQHEGIVIKPVYYEEQSVKKHTLTPAIIQNEELGEELGEESSEQLNENLEPVLEPTLEPALEPVLKLTEQNSTNYLKAAPYIKVRNKDYLTIVYGIGYDNPRHYQALIDKKKVGQKINVSIKEFEIGEKLLKIPYNLITANTSSNSDTSNTFNHLDSSNNSNISNNLENPSTDEVNFTNLSKKIIIDYLKLNDERAQLDPRL